MKSFLRNYLTPSEQRTIFIILILGFLSLVVNQNPFGILYSNEINPDSLQADLTEPYQLLVDIRTATVKDLMQIKGIGEKTAQKIITYREKYGFESNYDLIKIPGIGDKSLKKWLPYLHALVGDSLYSKNELLVADTSLMVSKDYKIDINKASLSELMLVKGIGEKRAQQIIDYRDKIGSIAQMSELTNIKGIGKKTLAKIEELFYIGTK